MSKSDLARQAIYKFMAECESTCTERQREQRREKLARLLRNFEQAATEAAYAQLLDDLKEGRLPPPSPRPAIL
jgi:hypothetical protein